MINVGFSYLYNIYLKFLRHLARTAGYRIVRPPRVTTCKQERQLVRQAIDTSSHRIMIDGGANIGGYSEQLIKAYPNIELHVFEPSKTNIDILHKKFSSNLKVKINHCALGKMTGQATLYTDQYGSFAASLTKLDTLCTEHNLNLQEKTKVIKFSEYYLKHLNGKIIDLLKLDIEGHEMYVLEDCEKIIDNIKCIQFEFNAPQISTRFFFKDFWLFFKKHNYIIYKMDPYLMELIEIKGYSLEHEYFFLTNYLCIRQ